MAIEIRIAAGEDERQQAYRLRYDVYVAEMGRHPEFADHERRMIIEPWDETADLFVAIDGGRVVGTLRYNRRTRGPLEYESLYEMERFGDAWPDAVSMTTKLMVGPEYRSSGLAARLAWACYVHGRGLGDRLNFIDCRPHLLRMYQVLGFRPYRANISLPSSGTVIPLVMIVDDNAYLEEIRSPTLRHARGFPTSSDTRSAFEAAFPEYANLRPQFGLDEAAVAQQFSALLGRQPSETLEIFAEFDDAEAATVLAQFDVVDFGEREWVFRQGDHSAGMFAVLSGGAEAVRHGQHGDKVVAQFLARECFGEMGFLGQVHRTASVRTAGPTRLLVLGPAGYDKLAKQNPALALKLLTNLFRLVVERFDEATRTRSELWQRLETLRADASHD